MIHSNVVAFKICKKFSTNNFTFYYFTFTDTTDEDIENRIEESGENAENEELNENVMVEKENEEVDKNEHEDMNKCELMLKFHCMSFISYSKAQIPIRINFSKDIRVSSFQIYRDIPLRVEVK